VEDSEEKVSERQSKRGGELLVGEEKSPIEIFYRVEKTLWGESEKGSGLEPQGKGAVC